MKKWLMALATGLAVVSAQAEAPRVRLFGSVAYGDGGDKIIAEQYSNGAPIEMFAGSGWTWTIGADMRLFGPLALQVSVGQQRNRVNGANFDMDFVRNPVEVLAFYSVTEQIRLGVGAHKTYNAKFTETGVQPRSRDYDGSTGAVLEGQYFFTAPTNERAFLSGVNLRVIRENFVQTSGTGTGTEARGDQVAIGLFFYY